MDGQGETYELIRCQALSARLEAGFLNKAGAKPKFTCRTRRKNSPTLETKLRNFSELYHFYFSHGA